MGHPTRHPPPFDHLDLKEVAELHDLLRYESAKGYLPTDKKERFRYLIGKHYNPPQDRPHDTPAA